MPDANTNRDTNRRRWVEPRGQIHRRGKRPAYRQPGRGSCGGARALPSGGKRLGRPRSPAPVGDAAAVLALHGAGVGVHGGGTVENMNVLKTVSRYTNSVFGPVYSNEGIESVNALELVLPDLFEVVDELANVNVSDL